MKFLIAITLLATVALVSAEYEGNGEPGCKTEQELEIRLFRDNWDPTAYWRCAQLNQAAVLDRCPDNMAFLNSAKECVSWNDWKWEEPIMPLSIPDNLIEG